jgi:hypothetical protein
MNRSIRNGDGKRTGVLMAKTLRLVDFRVGGRRLKGKQTSSIRSQGMCVKVKNNRKAGNAGMRRVLTKLGIIIITFILVNEKGTIQNPRLNKIKNKT